MLKIKDNVDLKELENFGFELYDIGLNEPYEVYKKYIKNYTSIDIYNDGKIYFDNDENITQKIKEEYIYDLIQAGLVEKVGDSNDDV